MRKLEEVIESIVSGETSLFEMLSSGPEGDYRAAVGRARVYFLVLQDARVIEKLVEEIKARITALGGDPDSVEIEKELSRKDGKRRFQKLIDEGNGSSNENVRILSGDDFESRVENYKKAISHVENTWRNACAMYRSENYALAVFLSILTIEEIGKLYMVWRELIFYDIISGPVRMSPDDRNHRRKHFIGVMSGALINARLERVLGKDTIRKILHKAESDELEKLRQSCLYLDEANGRTVVPTEIIDDKQAQVFTILSGELMAEVLGYFPWDFYRMIEEVIQYEREIGMPEKKIKLQ